MLEFWAGFLVGSSTNSAGSGAVTGKDLIKAIFVFLIIIGFFCFPFIFLLGEGEQHREVSSQFDLLHNYTADMASIFAFFPFIAGALFIFFKLLKK